MEEKKEIIDMLIQRETFYRCNEDGSFSKVDLVNEFYEDICKELDRAREEGRREQRELDCSLYGSACAEENFDEKWKLEFGMTEEKEII